MQQMNHASLLSLVCSRQKYSQLDISVVDSTVLRVFDSKQKRVIYLFPALFSREDHTEASHGPRQCLPAVCSNLLLRVPLADLSLGKVRIS